MVVDSIKKYGFVGALFVSLVFSFVSDIPRELIKSIFNKNTSTTTIIQNTEVKGDDNNCSTVSLFNNSSSKWKLTGYRLKNDSYCAHSKKEVYPLMWFNSSIPTLMTSFTISYRIPDEINELSPFVVGIGKDTKLLYLYLHENNVNIIGISKSKLSDDRSIIFSREVPLELPETPLPGSNASITLRGVSKGNNTVTYFFNYEYVPQLRPGTREEYSHSVDVYVPDPTLTKEGSLTEIGIGTLTGKCVHPLTYKLCQ